MDLFEALYTNRAMRRVSPDPVPDEVAAAMLDAAVRAPSGGNSQNWRFVVITDPDVREKLAPKSAEPLRRECNAVAVNKVFAPSSCLRRSADFRLPTQNRVGRNRRSWVRRA